MGRKLTSQEFDERAVLSRRCVGAYSSKEVTQELNRLKFLSNNLDILSSTRTK